MNGLIALGILLVLGVFNEASKDVARDAAIEREAVEKKQDVKPEQRIELIHPLEYTATVSQCNPKCVTRHYFPSSQK